MTDHAGPRRCECHQGNNFWHPPIEVTRFWHPGSSFDARFLEGQTKKNYIDQEAGKKYEKKLLEMVQVTVLFHTDEFTFVWSSKTGTGAKTAPRVQNLVSSTGGCQNLVPG